MLGDELYSDPDTPDPQRSTTTYSVVDNSITTHNHAPAARSPYQIASALLIVIGGVTVAIVGLMYFAEKFPNGARWVNHAARTVVSGIKAYFAGP